MNKGEENMKDKVEVIAEYAWNPVKDGGRTLLLNF